MYEMICELEEIGGEVDFDDFIEAISNKLGNKETKEGINRIFDLFDEDKTNTINLSNLKKVSKELGENLSTEELREMLKRAASDEKEISREDFMKIMTRKNY